MKPRLLFFLAFACAAALFAACAAWMRANPLPAYFDEAVYAESAIFDAWAATHGGAGAVAHSLLALDPLRPPLHRALALPVSIASHANLIALRVFSFVCFLLAALLLADAVRRVAGIEAAITAFLLEIAAPILVFSARLFGTEYALFLAVALFIWSLVRRHAIALAAAIALGLLAKVSFLFVAGPMLLVMFVIAPQWRAAMLRSSAIGFLISLIWWAYDPMPPLRSAFGSGSFIRHRLGPVSSPLTLLRFVYEMMRTGTGFGLALLIVLTVVVVRRRDLAQPRRDFILLALAGSVLLPILSYASGTHNPRHVAPAILLLLAAVPVALSASPRWLAAAAAVAVAQIVIMALPRAWTPQDAQRSFIRRGLTDMMAPVEQWEWTPLRALVDRTGLARPRIGILGETYGFNGAQIRYAWQRVARDVRVRSLYRWDADPPFNMPRAIEMAATADVVVTAPGARGDADDGQVPNNVYNAAFAEALQKDSRFAGPIRIDVGYREPHFVAVFFRVRAG